MTRRTFLAAAGTASTAICLRASQTAAVRVRIDDSAGGWRIPPDFLGFGYEVSEVAVPGFFSASNSNYIQFVRTLAPNGVVRIGGNTADFSSWQPDGNAIAKPKGTVVNGRSIEELGGFLRATGWKLIWVLNSGTGSPESAADQAAAVAHAAGAQLLAFEIGNEPDMFVFNGHRPQGYGYPQYFAEFRRFAEAVRGKVPNAPLAGPAVLADTGWTASMAADLSSQLTLLTQHYYINDQSTPYATLHNLLTPDPRLNQLTGQLQEISRTSGLPWRIAEVNSFSGGGKPGVSDVFAAALWALDLMFSLTAARCAGVNFETGVNHLGFVSSYSPIGQNGSTFFAGPVYYAMLAFRSALGGTLGSVHLDGAATGLAAWAFRDRTGVQQIVLINKNDDITVEVAVECSSRTSRAELSWLTAPALESKTGIAFAGGAASPSGTWSSGTRERKTVTAGSMALTLLPARAVVCRLI